MRSTKAGELEALIVSEEVSVGQVSEHVEPELIRFSWNWLLQR
jgi:hypothetical protein